MKSYLTIEKALQRLQSEFNWYHSFIRELYITTLHCYNKLQNDPNDNGVGDAYFPHDLRMVVAAAGNPTIFGIEFLCFNVMAFSLQEFNELAFDCKCTTGNVKLNFGNAPIHTQDCWVVSKEVQVAFLGKEYLGPMLRIGFELPKNDAIVATSIDELWRQCTNCSNAWRENPNVAYSRCPHCGQLTKLHSLS
jgi:hypothetical protein